MRFTDLTYSEIVGVLATLEKFRNANEKGNQFLVNFLSKQHTRLKGVFDRHVVRPFPRDFRRFSHKSRMTNLNPLSKPKLHLRNVKELHRSLNSFLIMSNASRVNSSRLAQMGWVWRCERVWTQRMTRLSMRCLKT